MQNVYTSYYYVFIWRNQREKRMIIPTYNIIDYPGVPILVL